jgi:molecular chaperone DnaJ
MAGKDYYLILGVSRSESTARIRARFRDLARAFHPDVAGPESTSAFQEISEAYEILTDPVARRRHNAELATWERRLPVERAPAARRHGAPRSLLAEPHAVRPSFDALVDRLFRNFTGIRVPKSERPEGLTFEIILTPDEAMRGVEVPIGVPRGAACPACDGMGRLWLFPCTACGGQAAIVTEEIASVSIPPLVRPDSVFEVPLHGLGIHNLYLRLLVRIE